LRNLFFRSRPGGFLDDGRGTARCAVRAVGIFLLLNNFFFQFWMSFAKIWGVSSLEFALLGSTAGRTGPSESSGRLFS
jgi:hypothetical protein